MDAVVAAAPLRHYVLSFPFALSLLAATNPKVLRALAQINYEVMAPYPQRLATESGSDGKTHAGAITYRFGSSPNLHLHVCVFDGVFVERNHEALRFSPAEALSRNKLCELLERFAVRAARWLRTHGLPRDGQDSDSNETRVFAFAEMLAPLAAARGTFDKVKAFRTMHGQAALRRTHGHHLAIAR